MAKGQALLLAGDGKGGLAPLATRGLPAAVTALAVGDLNGDGLPDLAVVGQMTSSSPEQLMVLLNQGAANGTIQFAPPAVISNANLPALDASCRLAAGTFTRSGAGAPPDLALVCASSPATVFLAANDGTGSFSTVTAISGVEPGRTITSVQTAGLNADGSENLAIESIDPSVPGGAPRVDWLMDQRGYYSSQQAIVPAAALNSFADYDGDGLTDSFSATAAGALSAQRGQTSGFEAAQTIDAFPNCSVLNIAAGNLQNNPGSLALDLVAATLCPATSPATGLNLSLVPLLNHSGTSLTITPVSSGDNTLDALNIAVTQLNGSTVPTGNVNISIDNSPAQTLGLSNGSALFTTPVPSAPESILATYGATDQFAASSAQTMLSSATTCGATSSSGASSSPSGALSAFSTQSQVLAPTIATVKSSANPSGYGQPVQFTSLVNTGGLAPTGSVAFEDGSNTIGTASVSPVQATNLVPFSNQFTQWSPYCGDESNIVVNTPDTAAPDGSFTATAVPVPSTFSCQRPGPSNGFMEFQSGTLSAGKNYVVSVWIRGASGGETVLLGFNNLDYQYFRVTNTWHRYYHDTSSISSAAASLGPVVEIRNDSPGSTVYFWGAQLEQSDAPGPYVATGQTAASGFGARATFTTSSLTAGSHAITAVYAGDTNTTGSTSPALTQTVNQAVPIGSISCSPASTTFGSSTASCTATLTPAAGGTTPTGSVTIYSNGSVWGENNPLLNGSAILSGFTGLNAGTYTITGTYSGDGNYSSTALQPTTLTIEKAPLVCSPVNANKVYGAPLPDLAYICTGYVNGDTSAVLSGSPSLSTATSPAGSYTITGTVGSLTAANYSITFSGPGTLTVGAVPLTVTASSPVVTYGAAVPAITPSYAGFVNGDGPTSLSTQPACSTTYTATSPVGIYPATCTGAADSNYTISYTPGSVTVGKATLAVVVDSKSMIYGGNLPVLTGTLTGVLPGDGITASYTTTGSSTSAAGSYPITATLNDPNAKLGNYSVSNTPGSLTIGKATLTISASSPSVNYGAAVPAITPSYAGFVNGDGPASLSSQPACSTTYTATSPVGSYPATCTGAADSSYTIAYVPGSVTVGQASATISWPAPAAIPYGTTLGAAELDASLNEPGACTYSPAAGTILAAGVHTLTATCTPTDTSDYSTPAPATVQITVNRATPSVVWPSAQTSIPYGTPLGAAQMNASVSGIAGTTAYTPAAGTVLGVGNHILSATFTPSDSNDYLPATVTSTLAVSQATPAASLTASGYLIARAKTVTLTMALPASGSEVLPSGTVIFTLTPAGSGTLQTATVAVANGTAAWTAAPAVGVYLVSATYSGDSNYTAASATTANITVTAASNFTATASPENLTLSLSGSMSATDTISINPMNLFFGTVAMQCSGLPAGASCAFSPATVIVPTPRGLGAQPSVTSILTIHATAATPAGSYPVIVTGASGAHANSVQILLNVTQ